MLVCVILVVPSACAGQPAAAVAQDRAPAVLYQEALRFEEKLELARAEKLYQDLLRRCDPQSEWRLRRNAQQGLRRIEDLRVEFSLSKTDLQRRIVQTYRGSKPEELADWEKKGWILSRVVDGKRGYSSLSPTNLGFFDTQLMARNESAARNYRQFAQLFLEESTRLDQLRASSPVPHTQVAPVRYVFSTRCQVRQADLPPGKRVRGWFPCPLLTPAVQNIHVLSVQPRGSLQHAPDLEADLGIAYLEMDRPDKEDLTIELKIGFDASDTDYAIDAGAIPPYDEHSELYRRFTRPEQQMPLSEAQRDLARTVIAGETNPYRRARKLYDWVCDNVKYNFVWRWRDATFTYGCASEEVRQRRIGDCVIQSVFYAALCRCVGIPARVCNGPIFPPGMKNDHVWAEIYFPSHGWFPVDVTYSEVASMVPGLSECERRRIRDFFFGRLDRWRICTQRNELGQELIPEKRSPRRRFTMFVRPELECGGQDVEKSTMSWECQPEVPVGERRP
jgi:transglutaminase-like putative cysteine protease